MRDLATMSWLLGMNQGPEGHRESSCGRLSRRTTTGVAASQAPAAVLLCGCSSIILYLA